MASSQHSGNVNMNMSLPVAGSREDSMQGTDNLVYQQNIIHDIYISELLLICNNYYSRFSTSPFRPK